LRPSSSAIGTARSPAAPEQRGTLERADGGTLFLDEVGDMSLKTQAKVLSALDDQCLRRWAARSPCASTCG
jgi:DNA-binding NtrC family response regulator